MNELAIGKCYTAQKHRSGISSRGEWELITSLDSNGRNEITIFVMNHPSGVNEGDTFGLETIRSIRVGYRKDKQGNWEKVVSVDADVRPVVQKSADLLDPFDFDLMDDPFDSLDFEGLDLDEGFPVSHASATIKAANKTEPVKSRLSELEDLVGLKEVKAEAEQIINMAKMQKIRTKQGLPEMPVSRHLIFSGNPGSGKTTVARALAEEFKACGVLSKGHLVEVSRSDLVAEYVGQTAVKAKKVLEKARGGVLFIDEAYTLISRSSEDYGQEAIDMILKEMEDGRDDLVVIAAGYTKAMQVFMSTNPGLRSRFKHTIDFPDYTAEEMIEIFDQLAAKYEFILEEDARAEIISRLTEYTEHKPRTFANGRDVRNFFEEITQNQASRVIKSCPAGSEQLSLITRADVLPALRCLKPAEPQENTAKPVRRIGF